MTIPGWFERIYTCGRCGKTFKSGHTSCLVLHAPGDCCHYGDKEINDPGNDGSGS